MKIKTISPEFHKSLFGNRQPSPAMFDRESLLLDMALADKGLEINDKTETVELPLPEFSSTSLKKWVEDIARSSYADVYAAVEKFSNLTPVMPTHYRCPLGWSKWDALAQSWESVNNPSEYLVFDFETHGSKISNQKPFTCMAIDTEGNWFAWVTAVLPSTVSFGKDFRLGIGHYVTEFDKRFVQESYKFGCQVLYIDTLSLHTAVRGTCDDQSAVLPALEKKWGHLRKRLKNDIVFRLENEVPNWFLETCGSSLLALSKFYLDKTISKDVRSNVIVGTTLESKREQRQIILKYNAEDVLNTLLVFQKLWAEYSVRIPSPVVFGGMLEKSRYQVHVDPDYKEKFDKVEVSFDRAKRVLEFLTASMQKNHKDSNTFMKDPHLNKMFKRWQEKDYQERKAKAKNPDRIKRGTLDKYLKSHWTLDEKTNRRRISLDGRIAPILLGVCYKGVRVEHNGTTWGIERNGVFEPLPHPTNPGDNVGKVLTDKFIPAIQVGDLHSDFCSLESVITEIKSLTQWTSNRKRLGNIFTVGNIALPDAVPFGTVSLRTSSKLWMLLPNDKPGKAGSEAKSWFKCLPGYIKVSSDYDSQEQIIAAALTDGYYGYPGLNLWGCQVYAGDKSDNSDQHSYIASKFGIPRNPTAKNCNYANQYMCGIAKLASMLHVGNKGKKTLEECTETAHQFLAETRGVNDFGHYSGGTASPLFNILNERAKEPNQKSIIYESLIPLPVDASVCGRDYGTTRINLSIQATGQELLHTLLVVVKYLTDQMGIDNQLSLTIHDDFHYYLRDNEPENLSKFVWILQVAHLVSKALLYRSVGSATMPSGQCWLSSIEVDKYFRKGFDHECITPTNVTPLPIGLSISVKDCLPDKLHTLPDWMLSST